MPSKASIVWSIKELVQILKARQQNEFDVNIGVSGKRGEGKCQAKGDKVLLSDGKFKNIEKIKIGDEVISPQRNGNCMISKVIGVSSHYEKEVYNVIEQTRKKRILYTCSGKHKIPVIKLHSNRTSKDDSTRRIYYKSVDNISAKKISTFKERQSHLVSFTTPEFETKKIKNPSVEPYCLGAFLGDGCFSGSNFSITTIDEEIVEYFKNNYKIIRCSSKQDTECKSYHFSKLGEFGIKLKELNLNGKRSGDKFIPEESFYYSYENRLKLLAGLIDTDGFISKNNQITVATKSIKLAEGIKRLVFSLGGYSLVRPIYKKCQGMKENKKYYDVSIQFKNPRIIPLRLKRKKSRLKERKINPKSIAIICQKTNPQVVYGIELDSPSKWYITNNYMITHNSTLLLKLFLRFKGFKQIKHQVYSQRDVISLLKNQQFSFCWDDEAINTGYKRNFQSKGQQELIKIITMYRDNFNIYASAIPFFYSLDKDLRELIHIHIHIIERGLAVILMQLEDSIHQTDQWDTRNNSKKEEKWQKKKAENPNFKFPYHRLSTFVGYLRFNDLTKNQREKYKKLKREKRHGALLTEEEVARQKEENVNDRIFKQMLDAKLTKEGLQQFCLIEGKKLSSMVTYLNKRLNNLGEEKTLKQFLDPSHTEIKQEKTREQLKDLIPVV